MCVCGRLLNLQPCILAAEMVPLSKAMAAFSIYKYQPPLHYLFASAALPLERAGFDV